MVTPIDTAAPPDTADTVVTPIDTADSTVTPVDTADTLVVGGDTSTTTDIGCAWEVHIRTEAFGGDVGWEIRDSLGTVVASSAPGAYLSTSDYYATVSLPAGSWSLHAIDSFGDGWSGGFWEILDDTGAVLLSGTVGSGSLLITDFDSGACSVDTAAPSDTAVPPDTADTVVAPVDTADTVVTPVDTADTVVTPVDTADTVVTPVDTADSVVTPVDTADTVVVGGDTSVTAGIGCAWEVHIRTEAFGGDVGWEIRDSLGAVVASSAPGAYLSTSDYYATVSLPAGSWSFHAIDSFGDGWSGGFWEILDEAGALRLGGTLDRVVDDGALAITAFESGVCPPPSNDTAVPPTDTILDTATCVSSFSPVAVLCGAPISGFGAWSGSTVSAPDLHQPQTCSFAGGAGDNTFAYTAVSSGTICVDLAGSAYDTTLYALAACDDPASEVACNDDASGLLQSALSLDVCAGDQLTLVVDGYNSSEGLYDLVVTAGACP